MDIPSTFAERLPGANAQILLQHVVVTVQLGKLWEIFTIWDTKSGRIFLGKTKSGRKF